MSFKIFGIKFVVSVPFAVMLAFLLLMDTTGLMSASLVAVTAHETGHLVAMKCVKCPPTEIKFGIGGVLIVGHSFSTFFENIIISLSGPLVNLLLFSLLWGLGALTNSFTLLTFSVVQLIVGAVNLLPVKGLDGGTVIKLLLLKFTKFNVDLVCNIVSIVFACVMLVLGFGVAVENVSNPSLLLLSIYIIILMLCRKSEL